MNSMTIAVEKKSTGQVAIRVERLAQLDRARYQAFVAGHPSATPYHNLAWLDAISQAYRHPCWVVSVADPGGLLAVLPLCQLRCFGKGPVVSLPFCDLAGPLYLTEEGRAGLQQGVSKLLAELGARRIEVRRRGSLFSEPELRELGNAGASPKVSMLLDLPETSGDLFASYKPKLRSQIRKAEKNGLTAEVVSDAAAIQRFYPVFAANMRRLGSPVHSRAWFECLQKTYGERLLVGLVRHNHQVVGAGIVLCHGQQACIPWASTLSEFNHLAPNMLLYWSLLSHVTDQGCRQFDFGRSSLGEGTYRFKKQWGAVPVALEWTTWTADGVETPAEAAQPGSRSFRIRMLVERCWQRLPMALANRLGPVLRKYVSL
ncbi:MAG TPA: FemAB family XrtA/PEP-CTERM system-associated protein [Marinobacter sp.]|nr:FemAB family XrtA/PEP-CTERM system-associated protein [Marinobacter sp.]